MLINSDVEDQLLAAEFAPGILSFGPDGARLMGRPVISCEACQAVGSVGDVVLMDPSEYLLATKSGGFSTNWSIHVRFVEAESVFQMIYRVDGQPLWASPLTPANGTDTKSPYVVLAERA